MTFLKRTLNIAMVGSGAMGKAHSAALANLKYYYASLPFEAKLHTLVTRSQASAQEKASSLGFENYTTDYESVLNNPEIDIIDICTPNICHYEQVKKALACGKNVLCEKPLGISAKEADELATLSKESGKVCGMVFNNRHLPATMRARELVSDGKLGEILSFRSAYLHSSAIDPARKPGWKQDKNICGGGVLFDLGSHAIDLLSFILGDKKENRIKFVRGMSQIAFPTRTADDGTLIHTNADEAFYMMARLSCGACGTIEASKVAVGTNDDFSIEIYGTKGALKFNLMNPNYLYFYDAQNSYSKTGAESGFCAIECVNRYNTSHAVFPGIKAPVGWFRGHIHSMYSYLLSVCEERPFSPDFSQGAYVNRVMEAAYISDRNKSEEQVNID